MKRNVVSFAVLVVTTLAWTSTSFAQASTGTSSSPADQALAARLAAFQQQQQVNQIEQQLEQLKAEHQQLVTELKALHEEALSEQAQETAGSVESLIGKLQSSFQGKVAQLERQAQQLQAAVAPDFTLTSFAGQSYTLSDLRGKIVVLEWVNDECPFSRYHYDTKTTMVDLANKYKDQGVVWLAVNSTNHTTPEANLEFAKSHELPYPILDDRSGAVGRLYDAKTTPHMIVVDAQGRIAYNGAIDNAPMGRLQEGSTAVNYVDQTLTELTSGSPVSTTSTKPYGCSVKYATST